MALKQKVLGKGFNKRVNHVGVSIKKSFEEGVMNIDFLDEMSKLKAISENTKDNNKKIEDFNFIKNKSIISKILKRKTKKPKTEKEKEKIFEIKVRELMTENKKHNSDFLKSFKELISNQVKSNVPVVSVYLCGGFDSRTLKNLVFVDRDETSSFDDKRVELATEYIENVNKRIENFFDFLRDNGIIHKNKIRVSVFGKWYDLPENIIDSIKATMSETKNYDNFFLNICINYDGQEEILSSAKILCKKTELGNISPEKITKEDMKDNIYSSYFPPPDKIVIFDGLKKLEGFLMWDSMNSKIEFNDSKFLKISKNELKSIFTRI